MGRDKATLVIDGSTLATRTAELLSRVVETAIEVGPGVSGLPATEEKPRGEGPLVAIAAGCRELRARGHWGGALVVACDLPQVSEQLLRLIAEWGSSGSVVPLVRGRAQPLCARWGEKDLDGALGLVNAGHRSLQHLLTQPGVEVLDESRWSHIVNEEQFFDIDTPEDLRRLRQTHQT